MSVTFSEQLAKRQFFDPKNMGVGGPIEIALSCSAANNQNFLKGYDQINWNHEKEHNHENMPKMRKNMA